jgi:hypothetical protein
MQARSELLSSLGLRVSLVLTLALLALGALALPGLAVERSGARAAPAPIERSSGESRAAVIPPGREADVMMLVSELDGSFAGRRLGDVRIQKSEIRIALRPDADGAAGGACRGPDWVQPPGGVRLTRHGAEPDADRATGRRSSGPLTLSFWLCDPAGDGERAVADADAARALARMAAAADGGLVSRIWSPPDAVAPRTAEDRIVHEGLVKPLSDALGGASPARIVSLLWLLCAMIAIGAPYLARSPGSAAPAPLSATDASDRRRRIALWVVAGLIAAGGMLRIVLASRLGFDGDEAWAHPSTHSVFSGGHDPSVHPPLFRVLTESYGQLVGWNKGDSLFVLRLPWLIISIATLVLLGAAIHQLSSAGPAPMLALIFVALCPDVAENAVLARPFGLAAAAVTAVVVALYTPATGAQRPPTLRLQLALAGLSLALWVDLVAGLAGALAIATYLASPGVPWRTRAVIGVCVLLIAAPLVPGALAAVTTQVHPTPGTEIDIRPIHGFGGGNPRAAAFDLATFASLGVGDPRVRLLPFVVLWWLFGAIATPRQSRGAFFALALIIVAMIALGTQVGMRPRNVLFLPHLGALVAAIAAAAASLRIRAA